MDNNLLYAVVITIFYAVRAMLISMEEKSTAFLWVSAFFVFMPFEFSKSITAYSPNLAFGTLGTTVVITMPVIMALCILIVVKWRRRQHMAKVRDYFVMIVFILTVVSLINPYNVSKLGTVIFLVFFASNIFLFYLFANFITPSQILRGINDGLLILCPIQLLLAICFPLLHITAVTTLFHSEAAMGATREGTRVGAVGFFLHPGNLGLFSIVASCFFMGCYLRGYKKFNSLLLLGVNAATIVLTYSRTSYITFVVVMFFVFYVYKNAKKSIFSPGRLLKFILPVTLLIYWVIFLSPFSGTFLQSDAGLQYDDRIVHYLMAYDIFQRSPFIGVGFNAHLAYISTQSAITKLDVTQSQFFVSNPIHNIHLIVLAEAGLIGFILWWIYLIRGIGQTKKQISMHNHEIISATFLGLIVCYIIYGTTGWAPFSYSIFPVFLFFAYFFNKLKISPNDYKNMHNGYDEGLEPDEDEWQYTEKNNA